MIYEHFCNLDLYIFNVTLWCLEVIVVLARSSTREISCLKWGNTHAQLTTWYVNDENKHDKIRFQLAAVDLNSSTLMVRNLCDIHLIIKDICWMCILDQYHKASGLKSCTAMCREQEENGVNIILLIQDGSAQYIMFFLLRILLSWKNMK